MFNRCSWAEQNVNPALFSRELMTNASSLVEDEEVSFLVYLIINISLSCSYSIMTS